MKTVVLVAPWFVPNNLASVHRARLWANHLPEFGWNPIILTVRPEYYEEKPEPELGQLLPQDLEIVRSRAFPITKPRFVGDIGWRSLVFMWWDLSRLIQRRKIDFVHFTVPSFPPALLGRWLNQKGVPYGVDYIDPWVPEKPFKYFPASKAWWSQKLGTWLEPVAVKKACLITGITEGYYRGVMHRNPQLRMQAVSRAMPYGFETRDHEQARKGMNVFRPVFPKDKKINLIYAGALLPRAHDNLQLFLKALMLLDREPIWKNKIRVTFIGTGPDPKRPDLYTIRWIAEKMGLGRMVTEVPGRLPYLDVLRNLEAADGIVVLGSDESHYSPSKIYQSMLSGKPIFGLMHPDSLATSTIREMQAGLVVTNPANPPLTAEGLVIKLKNYLDQLMPSFRAVESEKLAKWSARSSAKILVSGIDEAIEKIKKTKLGAQGNEGTLRDERGLPKASILNLQSSHRSRVLLVHPGIQHAPRLAEALEREGMLARFWTGWAKAAGSQSQLGKRRVGIPVEKLKTLPWLEWAALFLSKTGIDPEWVWHWRNRIFQNLIPDKAIADADVVIGFDTGSWLLAQKAKAIGKKFILDQSIGHPAARIPEMKKMGRAEETWSEPYQPRPGRLADWEKREHELADRIVVGSRFTQNTLIGQGVTDSKVRILPYGVGEEFVTAGMKRAENGKDEKIRFLFLGQLAQRKGVQFLLEAWKGLPAGRSELVLMGGGARYRWRQMAGEGVIFRGQAGRRQVLEEMGRSDVLVLPSLFEGFGLVILEAMAAGLPVITTTNTGGPDVIEDGKEGFIVPVGNVEALRKKMNYFIQNPKQTFKMGQAAHQKATQYTWERYGNSYAELIREVVHT